MGTNYYAYVDPCEHCLRSDKGDVWHIGKMSGGWQFQFHGYRGVTCGPCRIDSYASWVGFLLSKDHTIIIKDEYGEVISHAEFTDMVDASKGGMDMTAWARQQGERLDEESEIVDNDGFDVSFREFC